MTINVFERLFSSKVMTVMIWLVLAVRIDSDCKMEIYSDWSSQDWQIVTAGVCPTPPPPTRGWIPLLGL